MPFAVAVAALINSASFGIAKEAAVLAVMRTERVRASLVYASSAFFASSDLSVLVIDSPSEMLLFMLSVRLWLCLT